MSDKDSLLIFEAWNRRDFLKTLGKAAAAATTPLPKTTNIPVKAGASASFAPIIANDTNMYSNILYKTIYQKMQSTKDKLNVDDNMVKRVADAAYEAIKNDKRRYEKYVDSIDIYQSVSPSEPMSFDEFVAEADVHFSDIDEYYIMSKALKSKNDVEDVVKDVIDKDDDRDYLERDYASGPHMNSYNIMSNSDSKMIYEAYADTEFSKWAENTYKDIDEHAIQMIEKSFEDPNTTYTDKEGKRFFQGTDKEQAPAVGGDNINQQGIPFFFNTLKAKIRRITNLIETYLDENHYARHNVAYDVKPEDKSRLSKIIAQNLKQLQLVEDRINYSNYKEGADALRKLTQDILNVILEIRGQKRDL